MTGHQSSVPPAAARYFGAGAGHPTIAEVFHPAAGWRRCPHRKRVSLTECRRLRRGGATHVALASGRRVADFGVAELVRGHRPVQS